MGKKRQFKALALKGNVFDLVVGVTMGSTFVKILD
jgi:large-conductance mechanosensitive channel